MSGPPSRDNFFQSSQLPGEPSVNQTNSYCESARISNNTYLSDCVFYPPSNSDSSFQPDSSVGTGHHQLQARDTRGSDRGPWHLETNQHFGELCPLNNSLYPQPVVGISCEDTHIGQDFDHRIQIHLNQQEQNHAIQPHDQTSDHYQTNLAQMLTHPQVFEQRPIPGIERSRNMAVSDTFDMPPLAEDLPFMPPGGILPTGLNDLPPIKTIGLGCPIMMMSQVNPHPQTPPNRGGSHGNSPPNPDNVSRLPRLPPPPHNGNNHDPAQQATPFSSGGSNPYGGRTQNNVTSTQAAQQNMAHPSQTSSFPGPSQGPLPKCNDLTFMPPNAHIPMMNTIRHGPPVVETALPTECCPMLYPGVSTTPPKSDIQYGPVIQNQRTINGVHVTHSDPVAGSGYMSTNPGYGYNQSVTTHSFANQSRPPGGMYSTPGLPDQSLLQNGYYGYSPRGKRRNHLVNIRPKDKHSIKLRLESSNVIQVCGPPMAGKSTLVQQAVNEKRDEAAVYASPGRTFIQHHFMCKKISNFSNFLSMAAQKICPQYPASSQPDADYVLSMIRSVLQQSNNCHHVLIFNKCESLNSPDHQHQFVDFLQQIALEFSDKCDVTVIFTTYKEFAFVGLGQYNHTVKIDALTDIWDIVSLLQHFAPNVEILSYANICQRTLCFPEAIRLLAEEFIVDERSRVTPELLEKKINQDRHFLAKLFGSRLEEVEDWICKEDLQALVHFSHSIESSFTKAHLQHVSTDCDKLEWNRLIRQLQRNNVIRSVPVIGRLVVHPLLAYYCMTSLHQGRLVLQGQWYDHSCNKYTNFLCRILMNAEDTMRQHGRKGLVYGCLAQEWPHLRYLIERALHCNRNTYEAFLKISVSASGLILKCFAKEAQDFYLGLLNSAQEFGSHRDSAVLEACLGQAIAVGSGEAWQQAERHLDSAIQKLSFGENNGVSFFLPWAINRKAMVLHRQGKYDESLKYFHKGRQMLSQVNTRALGEIFAVSDLQLEEEIITQEIHETIPIIFKGNNGLARKRLDRLLEHINHRCENHPDLSILLNLIGLTEQRGNKDLASAVRWYKLSYNERLYLAKQCPDNLLVVLNNIAMILFRDRKYVECLKYLQKAVDIRRECGWKHFNTGLTLVHLCEVNLELGNYVEAFKIALEAEKILGETVKDHDMRLRVNMNLAHLRIVLRQMLESERHYPVYQSRQNSNSTTYGMSMDSNTDRILDSPAQNSSAAPNLPDLGQLLGRESPRLLDTVDASVTDTPSFQNFGGGAAAAEPGCQQITDRVSALLMGQNFMHRICEVSPTMQNISTAAAEIDPVDQRYSAEDFLKRLLQIASEITGTLSDDGQGNVLSAHEHIMLLNLVNSPQVYEVHRNALIQYTEENPWIAETLTLDERVNNSQYRCLTSHRDFYFYVLDTPYEQIDIKEFVGHILSSCVFCEQHRLVFTEDLWVREAQHCIRIREEKIRFRQQFERMSTDFNILPDDQSSQEPGGPNNSPGRNGMNEDRMQEMFARGHDANVCINTVSHSSGGQGQEISESSPGIPVFQALISNENLMSFPLFSPVLKHTSFTAVSSSSACLPNPTSSQESLQSMEDNNSGPAKISPKIEEGQKALWDEIQSRRTSTSSVYRNPSESSQGPTSSHKQFQETVSGSKKLLNIRQSDSDYNIDKASDSSPKKGSNGTKIIPNREEKCFKSEANLDVNKREEIGKTSCAGGLTLESTTGLEIYERSEMEDSTRTNKEEDITQKELCPTSSVSAGGKSNETKTSSGTRTRHCNESQGSHKAEELERQPLPNFITGLNLDLSGIRAPPSLTNLFTGHEISGVPTNDTNDSWNTVNEPGNRHAENSSLVQSSDAAGSHTITSTQNFSGLRYIMEAVKTNQSNDEIPDKQLEYGCMWRLGSSLADIQQAQGEQSLWHGSDELSLLKDTVTEDGDGNTPKEHAFGGEHYSLNSPDPSFVTGPPSSEFQSTIYHTETQIGEISEPTFDIESGLGSSQRSSQSEVSDSDFSRRSSENHEQFSKNAMVESGFPSGRTASSRASSVSTPMSDTGCPCQARAAHSPESGYLSQPRARPKTNSCPCQSKTSSHHDEENGVGPCRNEGIGEIQYSSLSLPYPDQTEQDEGNGRDIQKWQETLRHDDNSMTK